MLRPTRPLVHTISTRQLLIVELGALLVLFATCVAGPSRAADVGDLIEFQPRTKAQAADVNQNFSDVKFAVNSKSSDGIEFAYGEAAVDLANDSAQPTVALTLTLTAPGPGFVRVDFSAYLNILHTNDEGDSHVVCAIKTNTTFPNQPIGRLHGSRRLMHVESQSHSGTYYPQVHSQGVYEVFAAGSVTFNAVCYRTEGPGASIRYRSLTATYHSDRL